MPDWSRTFVGPLIALAAVVVLVVAVRPHGGPGPGAVQPGREVGRLTAQERAATFAFDPSVAPADHAAFLMAVSHARPGAQRLLSAIDGLVDVHIASTAAGIAGVTQGIGSRFSVTVNLGVVSGRYGQRGIDRTVLHELGHVVDFALVGDALHRRLDGAIPQGYGCDQRMMGGCADTRERFAESFAKWATGDIGVDLYLGYKVPPPDDLESWGAPLAGVAGGA
jgi:hypothetical protein